jgi:hypothetical protein
VPTAPTAAASAVPAPEANLAPVETANFRVIHSDRALAERVAQAAESARESQMKRWTGSSHPASWSPRCDVYLYATAKTFSRETGQPAESPGFSTMGLNSGKIIARRINLRADHPNLVKAILPHEVTHVVLADLFPHQQVPRWADEGMAVLAEPASEQNVRANDLEDPLATGRLFKVNDLMVMDYPDGQYWGLYYAQSVSLTRFLVESGTPSQFIKFVQTAQRTGFETALKQVYEIGGYADLQSRWLAYARSRSNSALAASTTDPESTPGTSRR